MNQLQILTGDCRDILPTLEAGSVQTCITSPPYWGLRDYGTAQWEGGDAGCEHIDPQGPINAPSKNSTLTTNNGKGPQEGDKYHNSRTVQYSRDCPKCGARRIDSQLGLEATPEEYLAKLVAVFREVWRVLKPDGTLWVNMGDSYAGGGGFSSTAPTTSESKSGRYGLIGALRNGGIKPINGLKPKDLCMMPARLAMALQADGWYLRSDIIWSKSNPMPESVRDRFCKSHEYIFLLSKSSRYYFDSDAVKEPATSQDLLSMQSGSSDSLFLQEQAAIGRPLGQVSRVHDDCQEDEGLRLEIQSNGKSSSEGETLLLFGEGPNIQEGVSAGLRAEREAAREVSDSQSDTGQGTALQSSHQAILGKSKGQSDKSTQRQRVSIDGEGAILQTQDRDQAQTPDQISRLHTDTAGMDSDKGSVQSSVQVLRERTPAPRNGSCNTTLERRDAHSVERGSGLSQVQRGKGQSPAMRTRRSVWHINTQPYAEAHFATFPEEIPKLCILAGTKPGDTVLDPFAGSGTVGKVALELGRKAVLIELNPAYIELAEDRTFVTPGFL